MAALDDDLAIVLRGQCERGLQFARVVRLRDSHGGAEIGGFDEHGKRQAPARVHDVGAIAGHRHIFDNRQHRSLQTRFIISLSMETAEAMTPAPT